MQREDLSSRRVLTLGALAGTLALTALVDATVRANTSGLFASSLAPWPTWLGMTATVWLAAAFAYVALRWSRPDLGVAVTIVVVGAIVGYAWPVTFTLGIDPPDFVLDWTQGPALMVWQGLLLSAIGIAALLRRLRSG